MHELERQMLELSWKLEAEAARARTRTAHNRLLRLAALARELATVAHEYSRDPELASADE